MSTMIYHLLSHIVSVLLDVSLQAVNLCTEVSEVHQKPRSSQIFCSFHPLRSLAHCFRGSPALAWGCLRSLRLRRGSDVPPHVSDAVWVTFIHQDNHKQSMM